jgi:hypothetical protein
VRLGRGDYRIHYTHSDKAFTAECTDPTAAFSALQRLNMESIIEFSLRGRVLEVMKP